MATNNLKNRLKDAGLTPEEFADIVQVDPKTVQRWLAGTTTPYARHRARIARALDLAEHELWPDEIPAPAIDTGAREHSPVAGNEITGTWAYATDESAPDPVEIIENSDGTIELLDNGAGIELTTALVDALVEQAEDGHRIRLLTCAPTRRLDALTGRQHIEIRVIHGSAGHSLIRVGDTMLLTFNLAAEANQPALLLTLARTVDAGLFDRLADNLDALWDDADETITNPQQIDAHLTNTGHDDEDLDEEQQWTDRPEPGELHAPDSQTAAPSTPPTHTEIDQMQRRWPRRPN